MNPPKIPHEDSSDRTEEDAVSGHEVEEAGRGGEDFPRDEHPGDEGAEELAAADVEVGREKGGEVVGGGEAVG